MSTNGRHGNGPSEFVSNARKQRECPKSKTPAQSANTGIPTIQGTKEQSTMGEILKWSKFSFLCFLLMIIIGSAIGIGVMMFRWFAGV